VGLRQPERRRDLGLGPLEEEPLEHDAPLALVERARGPRDERAVECELCERGLVAREVLGE
jgi:hypothetical protein